jgi:hypothetical protein
MLKGSAFVEYPRVREGYEVLKRATSAFRDFTPQTVWEAMQEDSLAFVVLRNTWRNPRGVGGPDRNRPGL